MSEYFQIIYAAADPETFPPEESRRVFCPYCGSVNLRLKPVWREFHFVSCLDCKAAGPVKKLPEDAWNAWATRIIPKQTRVIKDDQLSFIDHLDQDGR